MFDDLEQIKSRSSSGQPRDIGHGKFMVYEYLVYFQSRHVRILLDEKDDEVSCDAKADAVLELLDKLS